MRTSFRQFFGHGLLTLLLLISFQAVLAQELVVNGNFEAPAINETQYDTTTLPGWSARNVDLLYLNEAPVPDRTGRQAIDLAGSTFLGTIEQELPTTPGATYTLSFWMKSGVAGKDINRGALIFWDNKLLDIVQASGNGYVYYEYSLASSKVTTMLTIIGGGTAEGRIGAFIDDVSVRVNSMPDNFIQNGSFEEPAINKPKIPNTTSIPNWRSTRVDLLSFIAQEGNQAVDLVGTSSGSLDQTVRLPAGIYTLEFYLRSFFDDQSLSEAVRVYWNGVPLDADIEALEGNTGTEANGFTRYTYEIVSSGEIDNLRFQGLTHIQGDGAILDNVTLRSATPVVVDSDEDGLPDDVETNTGIFVDGTDTGTDPNNPDSDGDGLLDGVETGSNIFIDVSDTGTDPNLLDTDSDCFSDGLEVLQMGSSPLDDSVDASVIASELSSLATEIEDYSPSVFVGRKRKSQKRRQAFLSRQITWASRLVTLSKLSKVTQLIDKAKSRVDDQRIPYDWMIAGDEQSHVHETLSCASRWICTLPDNPCGASTTALQQLEDLIFYIQNLELSSFEGNREKHKIFIRTFILHKLVSVQSALTSGQMDRASEHLRLILERCDGLDDPKDFIVDISAQNVVSSYINHLLQEV